MTVIRSIEGEPLYPTHYHYDFNGLFSSTDAAVADYWQCGTMEGTNGEISDGVFRSRGPWQYDSNHLLAGEVRQILLRNTGGWGQRTVNGRVFNPTVLTNATVGMRLRGVGFDPGAAKVMPWVQARYPGSGNKYSNHGFRAAGDELTALLAGGQWREWWTVLTDDPADWVNGGAPGAVEDSGIYGVLPVPIALQYVSNFFPMIGVHPPGSQQPTGIVEVDWFDAVYLSKDRPVAVAPPQPPAGIWTPVFDPPLNGASTANVGQSFRGITAPVAVGGSRVRVTLRASPSAATAGSHVSIGKHAGGGNTIAVPVPLTFGGASGYSLPAAGSIISDEIDFVTAPGDVLVIINDSASDGQARTSSPFGGGTFFGPNSQTWNVAKPNLPTATGYYFGGKIEVRT